MWFRTVLFAGPRTTPGIIENIAEFEVSYTTRGKMTEPAARQFREMLDHMASGKHAVIEVVEKPTGY